MDNILNLINNGLFPIAVVLLLMYYINTTSEKLRTTIDTNTQIISELKTMIATLHGKEGA